MTNVPFRLLTMDPGTHNCGVSILDCTDTHIHVVFAETIDLDKLKARYQDVAYMYGDLTSRCHATRDYFRDISRHYHPQAFAFETPFVNGAGNVSSFQSAITGIEYAKMGFQLYNNNAPIVHVTPSVVKNALGVSGNSKDKTLMTKALGAIAISYSDHLNSTNFDEHTVDSICIGLSCLSHFYRPIPKV